MADHMSKATWQLALALDDAGSTSHLSGQQSRNALLK